MVLSFYPGKRIVYISVSFKYTVPNTNKRTNMSTYYQCICGYCTKNAEYKNYHQSSPSCCIFEKKSSFEDKAGIIYKATKSFGTEKSYFGKWYGSEDELIAANPNYDISLKVVANCDIAYMRLMTKAKQAGLVAPDSDIPMVRNGSADNLFRHI